MRALYPQRIAPQRCTSVLSFVAGRSFATGSDSDGVEGTEPSTTRDVGSEGEICEEGFWLEYRVAAPFKTPFRILDHVRQGVGKRTRRQWLHQIDDNKRPVALRDHSEDLSDDELLPHPAAASYRLADQEALQERRRSAPPPWALREMDGGRRLKERDGCIEIEGGGKLGNRISEVELPIEELRVDTRATVYASKKDAPDAAALGRRVENDAALRELSGREYKPMMLLTVGAQGSGKSKFALELVEYGALPWARINQDTIRLWKRGTKEDCVSKAKYLMDRGYCVVIDRMNYSVDQRGEFVELAKRVQCPIHAVVFRLPFVENVYNVAQRRGHEGNFEGDSDLHRQIIYYTRARLFQGGNPKDNNEGFNSVFECRSNEDYAFAFRQWMNFGRPQTNGKRMTLEAWQACQKPWRIEDTSLLKETEEIVNQEELWLRQPRLPVLVDLDLDSGYPSWAESTVGYLPSRDGSLESDDDRS